MTFSTVQIKPICGTQLAPAAGAEYYPGVPAEGIPDLTTERPIFDPTRIPLSTRPVISPLADKILRYIVQQGGQMYGDPAQQVATALGLDQQAVLLAFVELNRAGFMESKYA